MISSEKLKIYAGSADKRDAMQTDSRLRRHVRQNLTARVRLSWVLSDGVAPSIVVKGVDISEGGLRVISAEPVPLRQYVSFHVEGINLAGSASVRSCARQGTKYLLGLEFAGGTKWIPPAA